VAEALTTRLVAEGVLPAGSRAASAGTHAIAGRAADPRGQVVARELGVSLEAHRSQPLSDGLVGEADLVLAMDLINEAEIAARFPWAEPKLRLLGAFGAGSPVIPDPYMGDEEAVRAAFRKIAHCLDEFARHFMAKGVLTDRDGS
jgi:protein-tyrosine phosphatase